MTEEPKSGYINVNTRLPRALHLAMGEYRAAMKKLKFQKLSQNQLIVNSIIEKLEREGYLPTIESEEVVPEVDLEQFASDPDGTAVVDRPWETAD